MLKRLLTDSSISKVVSYSIALFFLYVIVHYFVVALVGSLTQSYAPIKIAKDVLIFALFVCVTLYALLNQRVRLIFWNDWIIRAIYLYVLLHVCYFALSVVGDTEAAVAGLIYNLRFVLLFIIIRAALFHTKGVELSMKAHSQVMLFGVVISILALSLISFLPYDSLKAFGYGGTLAQPAYTTVDNDMTKLRAFGTLAGPNEFGAFLIIAISFAVVMLLRKKSIGIAGVLLILLVALTFTYSRSAMLGLVSALIAIGLTRYRKYLTKRRIVYITGTVIVGLATIVSLIFISPQVRLAVLHSSPGEPLFEGSTQDHLVATHQGIKEAVQHPFGLGLGSAGPASFYSRNDSRIAENYYVQIAQEVGVLGLFIFMAIIIGVGARLYKLAVYEKRDDALSAFAALIGISIVALLLHAWADEATAYVWWGLAALTLYSNRQRNNRKGA